MALEAGEVSDISACPSPFLPPTTPLKHCNSFFLRFSPSPQRPRIKSLKSTALVSLEKPKSLRRCQWRGGEKEEGLWEARSSIPYTVPRTAIEQERSVCLLSDYNSSRLIKIITAMWLKVFIMKQILSWKKTYMRQWVCLCFRLILKITL